MLPPRDDHRAPRTERRAVTPSTPSSTATGSSCPHPSADDSARTTTPSAVSSSPDVPRTSAVTRPLNSSRRPRRRKAMSRATRIATVVGLLIGLAAMAGPSLAANPTKGGKYVGPWNNGPIGPYPHQVTAESRPGFACEGLFRSSMKPPHRRVAGSVGASRPPAAGGPPVCRRPSGPSPTGGG